MKPTVYVETTIPSYLAARPSRDLIVAGHQQITRDWWDTAHRRFELLTSTSVMREIEVGDPQQAAERLELLRGIAVMTPNEDVLSLTRVYDDELGLQGKARRDVTHIAFAVSYEADYLVTWNCSHIANGSVIRRLQELNLQLNRYTPLIVTPEELMET